MIVCLAVNTLESFVKATEEKTAVLFRIRLFKVSIIVVRICPMNEVPASLITLLVDKLPSVILICAALINSSIVWFEKVSLNPQTLPLIPIF